MISGQLTSDLADLASGIARSCDAATLDRARLCLLDLVAVAVAGADADEVTAVRELVVAEGAVPVSTLIGTGLRASARQAALVNGTAAHFHDYDDIHLAVPGHATAPVASAVWAVAEAVGATGLETLQALVAGVEIACRLGQAISPGHYVAGWHASSTIGALAAAGGCGVLMELDTGKLESAIGLAVSCASGVRGAFGAIGKPLQIGLAGAGGVLAAELARRGVRSQPGLLERPDGFLATFAAGNFDAAALSRPAPPAIHATAFKRHAACFLTHASIDAAQVLRDKHRLRIADVRSVVVDGSPDLATVCDRPRLATTLDSKFSVQFAVAAVLAGQDTASLALFDQPPAAHDALAATMACITVLANPDRTQGEAELTVLTLDRQTLVASGSAGVPASDIAAESVFVFAKARSVCAPALGPARTDTLISAIMELGEGPLPNLGTITAPSRPKR